jgi:hypothetical protein
MHRDIARGLARPLSAEDSVGGVEEDFIAPQLSEAARRAALLPKWMEGGAAGAWRRAAQIDEMVAAVREKMASLAVAPTAEHIALRIEAYLFIGQIDRALDQVLYLPPNATA